MSHRKLLLALSVTLAAGAAASPAQPPPENRQPRQNRHENPPVPVNRQAAENQRASVDAQAPENRPPVDPDVATLVEGNTRFAFDLLQPLQKPEGNLIYSPASISTALALTYAGARGDTALEMATVLHFDLEPDRLHAAFAGLLASLEEAARPPGCELRMANALWPQDGYTFQPEFLRIGRLQYQAGLQTVDYVGSTELARRTINTWVAEQTAGRIKDLIKRGILTADTRLVLTNAIYFKGQWLYKFDRQATRPGPFTLLDGTQTQVPLMRQAAELPYAEPDGLQVLELPYAGEELSMVVLLPRAADGLPALEQALSAKALAGWLAKLGRQKVNVVLPRFKMTSDLELRDALSALGMRDAFTDKADFSGMDGTHYLFLSQVVHQAYIEVNEEGSEAAAATGVVMKLRATPAPPPEFRADHPFLLLIRDTRNGSILFLGRVANPSS